MARGPSEASVWERFIITTSVDIEVAWVFWLEALSMETVLFARTVYPGAEAGECWEG